jgi:hypothetical protein
LRTIRRTAIALGLGLAIWAASAAAPLSAAAADTVLQVVAVKVNPGQQDAYVAKLGQLKAILKRLGVKATMRAWQATAAGDATGTVVVGLEFPDLAAYADGSTKIQKDAEWQTLIAGLDSLRTTLSMSLYREVTP